MKKKPFHYQSEFTMTHNIIIDNIMPTLSGSEWKVLTVIIRKTIGWHKECDELSFSQIKTLAGIETNTTVSKALKKLEGLGVIKIDRPDLSGDDPARFWKSNIYSLNLDFEVEINEGEEAPSLINNTPPSLKNRLPPCPINEPPLVQKIDTQNKDSLNKKDSPKKKAKKEPSPSGPIFMALVDICQIDMGMASQKTKGQLKDAAERLLANKHTVEVLRGFETWWYANDWRGKKQEPPTLDSIKETWGQYKKSLNGGPKHVTRPTHLTPEQLEKVAQLNADQPDLSQDRGGTQGRSGRSQPANSGSRPAHSPATGGQN